MVYLEIRLPDVLFDTLQASGTALQQNWEEIIQRALKQYLEDFDDLTASARRLRRPDDSDQTTAGRSDDDRSL